MALTLVLWVAGDRAFEYESAAGEATERAITGRWRAQPGPLAG